jgi:hypothetical protein
MTKKNVGGWKVPQWRPKSPRHECHLVVGNSSFLAYVIKCLLHSGEAQPGRSEFTITWACRGAPWSKLSCLCSSTSWHIQEKVPTKFGVDFSV